MLQPLNDRVLVRVPAAPAMKGKIHMPDTAREKPLHGEIVAVGAGRLLESGNRAPMQVKVGDIAVFSCYGGSDVEVNGEAFKIFGESELLGVLLDA